MNIMYSDTCKAHTAHCEMTKFLLRNYLHSGRAPRKIVSDEYVKCQKSVPVLCCVFFLTLLKPYQSGSQTCFLPSAGFEKEGQQPEIEIKLELKSHVTL